MNLANIIEPHDRDRIALISGGVETAYGELSDRAGEMRAGLQSLGLGRGDRVVILCGNNTQFVVAYLAILGIGAVAVPLNPMSPAAELERELAAVDAAAAIVGPTARSAWSLVDTAARPPIVVAIESNIDDGAVALSSIMGLPPVPVVPVEPDDLAVLVFTSGTAGAPRPAMLTHRNLLRNIEQDLTTAGHVREGDIVYGVLPLFHIFGLNVEIGVGLAVGATIVLVQRFDPLTAAESIRSRGCTVVPGAPPLWTAFAHFDELKADSFASVRLALSGAARLPEAVSDRFFERFGIRIREGYGLTEASPVVTSSNGIDYRPQSVGHALEGVEVRVIAEDGSPAPVGDSGEIWVRGDNVFAGYWNDEEATNRVLVDGWLRTGDIGVVDDDGYLYLVDRAKDLIIVSGFNVFPAEVEAILQTHPAVAEVGVIGVPHPHRGEAVKAFVRLEDGAFVDEDALIDHARRGLARYKCPSKILFVDELPRNTAGKLKRRELVGSVLED